MAKGKRKEDRKGEMSTLCREVVDSGRMVTPASDTGLEEVVDTRHSESTSKRHLTTATGTYTSRGH